MSIDNLQEMKALPQWIVYRIEERNGKKTKVPYQPAKPTVRASSTDTDHWSTYQDAKDILDCGLDFDGLGFILTAQDPFCCIDLDVTDDPERLAFQKQIVENVSSYSEVSPSGRGMHIWCKVDEPFTGINRNKIEIYSQQRMMTMTGKAINNSPIVNCTAVIKSLRDFLVPAGCVQTQEIEFEEPAKLSTKHEDELDQKLIQRASSAANGELFSKLFAGDWKSKYPSQSDADMALMNLIAFYTFSKEQCRRLFLKSGLVRAKTHRPASAGRKSYLDEMIDKSFDQKTPPMDFSALGAKVAQQAATEASVEIAQTQAAATETLESAKDPAFRRGKYKSTSIEAIPKSARLIDNLMDYLMAKSPLPVPHAALVGSIGLLAGILGKSYNIMGNGLNQYLLYIAKSGTGKEAIATGIDHLVTLAQKNNCPAVGMFRGPRGFASVQGIHRALMENKCFYSSMTEFWSIMKSIADPRAQSDKKEMLAMMLSLWSKSGAGSTVGDVVYSKADNNLAELVAPALTIIAETNPDSYFSTLSDDLITNGLLPRMLTIEYTGGQVDFNYNHHLAQPSKELLDAICKLATFSKSLIETGRVIDIPLDDASGKLYRDLVTEMQHKTNEATNESTRLLWSRVAQKTLRLAGLLAVCANMSAPVVTAEHFIWAKNLVSSDVAGIVARFGSGDIGENVHVEQLDAVRSQIKKFFAADRLAKRTDAEKLFISKGCVPYVFLSTRCLGLSSFKNDKLGATTSLKRAIETLRLNGEIALVPDLEAATAFGSHGAVYAKLK